MCTWFSKLSMSTSFSQDANYTLRTVRPLYGTGLLLPSRCCILCIFSTNISTEYFKHAAHSPFFFLVYVLFTFYIQNVLKFQCKLNGLKSVHHRTIQINHQRDATIFPFIILTYVYRSTCFGRFSALHQELNDYSGRLWF
jgi:hypothetical protein